MDEARPVITYQADAMSAEETAIDISIDRPLNGFFGVRMLVPTPKGSAEEQQAKILDWVKRRVGQHVGDAVNHVTFQAV
jgi:hypothetical protein